jgi:hypothetical protein
MLPHIAVLPLSVVVGFIVHRWPPPFEPPWPTIATSSRPGGARAGRVAFNRQGIFRHNFFAIPGRA